MKNIFDNLINNNNIKIGGMFNLVKNIYDVIGRIKCDLIFIF